jgi:hypothetical protein
VVGALLGEGEADEAAAVAGHEVDGLGGDELGGQGEVALVLAVLVVDHDHHAAGADLVECAGDVGEGRLGGGDRRGCFLRSRFVISSCLVLFHRELKDEIGGETLLVPLDRLIKGSDLHGI